MRNIEAYTYFDKNEFGFCFKIARLPHHPDYWWQFDMHFLFFSCWINFISKL